MHAFHKFSICRKDLPKCSLVQDGIMNPVYPIPSLQQHHVPSLPQSFEFTHPVYSNPTLCPFPQLYGDHTGPCSTTPAECRSFPPIFLLHLASVTAKYQNSHGIKRAVFLCQATHSSPRVSCSIFSSSRIRSQIIRTRKAVKLNKIGTLYGNKAWIDSRDK
jgi:hypothetical protein